MANDRKTEIPIELSSKLPVLPLKETIVFPYMIYPLLIGRESSIKAVQNALLHEKYVLLIAQKDILQENPEARDLYRTGVIARILQILKLPNGIVKVLVEGLTRAKVNRFIRTKGSFTQAKYEVVPESDQITPQNEAALRHVISQFKEYVLLNRDIPDEILLSIESVDNIQRVSDFIAAHVSKRIEDKQMLVEVASVDEELMMLVEMLQQEKDILEIEKDIDDQVRGRMQSSQRNFYLQEQLRVIKQELGEEDDSYNELGALNKKIKKAKMPREAKNKALEDLEKLRYTPPMSPEYTVIRNYLDWLLAIPWNKRSRDNLNLITAKKILDEDHYGLKKPKERILEQLSVMKLVEKVKGPILCLVGPPGVGKTSLGKSIARSLDRQFIRISLGGARDEAEIRGHRRTYIGSMPGRIIQSLKKAGTKNPVFLLDELDKMSMDFRGDPASALLEVLDPEQNKTFSDHYIEVEFDLSEVLFITTANVRHNIPEPLLDRMEVIDLPGYMEYDKLEIARRHLIPKQLNENGLKKHQIKFTDSAILGIIRNYSREAGVRNLERSISNICRKIAKEVVLKEDKGQFVVTARSLKKYLGVIQYSDKHAESVTQIGSATGLAWTEFGGDILQIEVTIMKGKSGLTLTGQLGDVMKESARAALSFIRSNTELLEIDPDVFEKNEIHIHAPEGAIPKDGPSAGITMAVAMISAFTRKPVDNELAMTGEITLRGNVLPIGGLTEKLLAARRSGIKTVLLPEKNRKDLSEISTRVTRGLQLNFVGTMNDVLKFAFRNGFTKKRNTVS
ncbi:MAG TPA: endopeptidase La [Bacteroidetes bacterium]|nr:endopeptidase La [Bacteroidota bacterium]